MTLSWRYAVASDVGKLRDGNEDAAFAGPHLLAVADGMGGHAAGEVASAAVIAALERLDGSTDEDPEHALRDAVAEANATLRDMVAADADLQGMGTTVTAVLADGDQAWLAHVGDSRAYRLRDGALEQLTHDHTYVQQLVDQGRIAAGDASTHPQRNVITRALDGRANAEVDLARLDVRPGDRLLLCSDGLSAVVRDETIATVLTEQAGPDEAVQQLVDLALRAGGPDNITCIVADPVDAPADPEPVVAGAANAQTPEPREDVDPRIRAKALRRRRAGALLLIAAVALMSLAAGGRAWVRRQYYVGVDHGQVAIFRGVEGTVAGVHLSEVTETSPLAVTDLPDFEQRRVRDGIHADGLDDARAIVTRLARAAGTP